MYGEIVPPTDLVVTLLNEMQAAGEQSRINLKRKQENEEILEGETERFSELKKESERLNRLLPAEIALLRSKLQEGVPCPVCGSLHHPAQSVTGGQSLQEEELSKAKRKVSSETERLTAGMEKRKAEIMRLGALSEHYAVQSAGTAKKVENYLSALPLWKEELEKGSLINKLKDIAGQWKTNSAKIIALEQSVNNKQALLQGERNNLAEAICQLETKERKKQETAGILKELQKERTALLGGKPANEVSDYFANRRKELAEELKKSAESKSILASGQEMLKGILSRITSEISQANERYLALQKEIDQWLDRKGTLTPEQLAELLGKDKQWIQTEKQFLQDLKERETACKATLDEREKTLSHHDKARIKPQSEGETKEYLAERLTAGSLRLEQVRKRLIEIEVAFDNHHKGKERIKALAKELAEKEVTVENWRKLNELFGSASGAKFKEIAQGYTLDALLTYANKHLRELSGRYELQRIPNTLALQVADLDMLGEIRTVHSLSGGESFLISLALALGLSSLSSNRMKIESLFIDEGFGSLDADALRVAIDALERLQTQGRKIGIISHVAEMTERITAQICVIKTGNGRSGIRVTGNG
jgi:exonuclease SbcC